MAGVGGQAGERRAVAADFGDPGAADRAVAALSTAGVGPGDVTLAPRGGGRDGALVTVAAGDHPAEVLAILERHGGAIQAGALGEGVEDEAPPDPGAAPAGGAVAGAVAGATLGTVVAGPLGTLLGGVAGAAAGAVVGETVKQQSEEQDNPNG